MIDVKWLREHTEEAARGFSAKQVDVGIDRILTLDDERRVLVRRVEDVAAKKRGASQVIASAPPEERKQQIAAMRTLDADTSEDRERLAVVERELEVLLWNVPNLPLVDVPIGKDESGNVIERTVGELPGSIGKLAHWEIGRALSAIDTDRGAKVAGARFGYLTGPGAKLALALIHYATRLLEREGFTLVIPPVLVRSQAMEAMGYTIHGGTAETYYLEPDDLYLVGTSEQSLGPMHMDEILNVEHLPLRYAGVSPCFRRESGSYGKDTKGVFRVHQFHKVEMFSFTTPEQSLAEHAYLLALEERILKDLEIPYQVVRMCTGDLGAPAAAKYDLEGWFPSEGRYRELTSTSNCTDWQARRLRIRYRTPDGTSRFLHTLNGTAIAIERTVSILFELHQQPNGTVRIPTALQEAYGGSEIVHRARGAADV